MKKDAGIFAAGLGPTIALRATLFVILVLTGFYVGQFADISSTVPASYDVGLTMAFMVLSWASVINIFNVRSNESIFKLGFFSNMNIFIAALVSILVSAVAALFEPLARVFSLSPISGTH